MNTHNGHYSLPWVEGRGTLQVYHSWSYKFKTQCCFENLWQFHECRQIAVTNEESLGQSLQMHLCKPGDLHVPCVPPFVLLYHTAPSPDFRRVTCPGWVLLYTVLCLRIISLLWAWLKKNKSDERTQERMKESWQPNIDKWKTKVKNPGMWIH